MKRATNRDGYNLVLSHFAVDGEMHGAKSRLAVALGCTRAAVSVWEKEGIPLKHIPALKKLTGLRGRDILPEVAELME